MSLQPEKSQEETEKQFRYWRFRVFYGIFIGYSLYYFTRKSFAFAMPALVRDLGYDKADLGIIGTVLAISYGMSKFSSGLLTDKTNPRILMGIGLIVTGIVNICFGFSSSILAFAVLWGFNGFFQGFGAPPCAKLLIHWFPQKERGRWWSIWNTSHNTGSFLCRHLVILSAAYMGWRYSFFAPGIICMIGGFFLLNRLRDTPASLGLPTVEEFHGEVPVSKKGEASEKPLPVKEIIFKHILGNKLIPLLGISYFFVYMIRTGMDEWSALYFVEVKGYDLLTSGWVASSFEVGGFCGSLTAGWASDTIFKGRRGPVNVICMLGALTALVGLWQLPYIHPSVDALLMFSMGFMIFGPQMLIGMLAAESTDKKAAATATGFVGWFAYMGAASAGYPLGKIAQEFGWSGYYLTLSACCVIVFFLLLPFWSVVTATSKPSAQPVKQNSKTDSEEAAFA